MEFPITKGSQAHSGGARRATIYIVCAALAAILLTWIAVAFDIRFERRAALRVATAQNTSRALMLQQFVKRTLDAANIATLHAAEHDAIGPGHEYRGTPGHPKLIGGPIARNPIFLGLSIVDENGEIVATTVQGKGPMRSVADHPAFRAHITRDSNELFVSRPALSRFLDRKTIWLSRRLNRPDGRFAGVVAINMDPAQLTAIYNEAPVEGSEVAWVAGFDGIVRSRRTSREVTAGEDVGRHRAPALQVGGGDLDFVGRGAIDGRLRLVSRRRVPGYPLFVSYSVRQADVLRATSGRARLLLIAATLVTIIAIVLAVTLIGALRRRERRAVRLAAANRRLEEAQRVGRIGDWSIDLATRETRWSPQLFEMYERDPALGAPLAGTFDSCLEPKSLVLHRAAYARVVETGAAESWEVRVRLPSGAARHHLVSAVPTRNGQGAMTGMHGTIQDITERKTLEALRAEVAHLSRVEAMNAMAATLAHELNQPLTAATNYLSVGRRMVLDPAKSSDQTASMIEAARDQIGLAGEIIQRARAMVAREPTRLQPVAIEAVIADALALLAAGGDPGPIAIETRLDADARTVLADNVQIQQVLMNLIRNASQAAAGAAAPRALISSTAVEGNQVCVSVEDNGPGFSGDMEQVFSPFVTDGSDGLGLGLSISRTIVEAHGGRIWAENAEQGGGRVSFTLATPGEAAG